MIEVTEHLLIPEHELAFTTARSSGPGGQHVNKVSSRVTLLFDVPASASLSEAQKQRILTRLATRISKDGTLRVVSQKHRSQAANRQAAVERFVMLMRDALTEALPRHATNPPRAARERRLEAKRQHSRLKQQRSSQITLDE